jgi:hypothetical protein
MTDTLVAALGYAAQGWRVLPIMPGQKRPPMAAWQHAATTDPTTIESWWTQLYRDHGLGVATGPESGIFIVDVDVANGKRGDESLQELVDTYGALPETATVITASGGTHLYFRYPEGQEIRNSASGRLGEWLDVRGIGGQCLAPPTIAANGKAYEWEGGEPGEIAEAPGWLLELLKTPEREQITYESGVAPAPHSLDGPASRFNDSTTWDELLTRDGWTLGATLPDGEQRWTRPGKDERDGMSATVGHDGRDVLKVFTSSVPGLEADKAYSRFGYEAAMRHGGDRSAFASELVRSEIVPLTPFAITEPLTGTTDLPYEQLSPEHREELAHLVNWDNFWTSDKGEEEWIAYPLIPANRSVALYAPAKAGKSTIALAIVAAVATGRRILGDVVADKKHILYLDYEMTEDDLHERLSELGYDESDDMTCLHYALLPSLPPLDTMEGAVALMGLVDRTEAECVVVDTFGRAVEGDEDKADTVRAFYRHTGLALKARGVAVMRTDHSGKDVAKGQRGSSAKNDDVDVVWQLSRKDEGITIKRTHSRISWVPNLVNIKRKETDCGYDYVIDRGLTVFANGTANNAARLDAAGVPIDATVKEALALVKAKEGKAFRRELVIEALAFRKIGIANTEEIRRAAGVEDGSRIAGTVQKGREPSTVPELREPTPKNREPWEPSPLPALMHGNRAHEIGNRPEPANREPFPHMNGERVPSHVSEGQETDLDDDEDLSAMYLII